jgi:Protein of unknown function (DUF1203)
MQFIVRGLTQDLADEVRRTGVSPGYGHPTHIEVARGTGPCRCCLEPFVSGRDARVLFTYRPPGDSDSLMAPGPVFIHAQHCAAWSGTGFPDALRVLPLAFEARATGSRVTALSADDGESVETQIERLFRDTQAQWIQVRHAHAGCFIARVDRA